MATKRTPLKRNLKRRITPEAVAAYVVAKETWPVRSSCDRGGKCQSKDVSAFCKACTAHLDACRAMYRLLDIKPWEVLPIDADVPEPPEYMATNPLRAPAWRAAYQLRLDLEDAAEAMEK